MDAINNNGKKILSTLFYKQRYPVFAPSWFVQADIKKNIN